MKFSTQSNEAPLINEELLRSSIIFEDDDIVVVNKPGWLVCHPSKRGPWSSLVGATRELLGLDTIFLVGRLDRETSGIVLMAKNQPAGRIWQKALEQKQVKRTYLAVVEGELNEEVQVTGFVGNDPDSKVFVKQRVTVKSRTSKKSETRFFPLYCNRGYTFISVVTKTGRKHQIRLHAQSIGFPLVGEKLYGHDESYYLNFCESGWNQSWMDKLGMDRQALHARRFGYLDGEESFEAEIPSDIMSFLVNRMNFQSDEMKKILDDANLWENQQLVLE
ncbi:RluA family pseudouridine synthase [Opitutales bacterium]|nr:RluA family pseudouridine synthase [Opitutales bacterium]